MYIDSNSVQKSKGGILIALFPGQKLSLKLIEAFSISIAD